MVRRIRLYGEEMALTGFLAACGIGLAGALVARLLHAPLPWLFGSILAVGAAAIAGLRVAGAPVAFPPRLRNPFIPVIGVSIGGAFTPGLLQGVADWWPSLLCIFLYVPVVHVLGYLWFRRVGGLSVPTAWFGAMPGGFVEAITLGGESGAEEGLLAALQFLRLILCILLIPLGFSIIEGAPVGSAAGLVLPGSDAPLTLAQAGLMLLCGGIGAVGGARLGLPAGVITGPILLSGAAHLSGLLTSGPPGWAISLTQLVIGTSLGIRFRGVSRRDLSLALRLSGSVVAATLAVATGAGALLGGLVGEPVTAVLLAFAPGGLVEMSLVALSLHVSTLYVTAHHVLRILLAVGFGQAGYAIARRLG